MSHFAGMNVTQRQILHGLLNTQWFREMAMWSERNCQMSARKLHWERALTSAAMLVELTDMMVRLKDPNMNEVDARSARLLFDTIRREVRENGHDIPVRPVVCGGVDRGPVVAPAQDAQGTEPGQRYQSSTRIRPYGPNPEIVKDGRLY